MFVGITESELDAIREDSSNISLLVEKMKKDNPELITDMKRKKSYLQKNAGGGMIIPKVLNSEMDACGEKKKELHDLSKPHSDMLQSDIS